MRTQLDQKRTQLRLENNELNIIVSGAFMV